MSDKQNPDDRRDSVPYVPGGNDSRIRELVKEQFDAYREGIKDGMRQVLRDEIRESLDDFDLPNMRGLIQDRVAALLPAIRATIREELERALDLKVEQLEDDHLPTIDNVRGILNPARFGESLGFHSGDFRFDESDHGDEFVEGLESASNRESLTPLEAQGVRRNIHFHPIVSVSLDREQWATVVRVARNLSEKLGDEIERQATMIYPAVSE